MAYTFPQSWNDKGMDWDNPDITNKDYIMALALAILERNWVSSNNVGSVSYLVAKIAQADYNVSTTDLESITQLIFTDCNVKNTFVPTKLKTKGEKIIRSDEINEYYGYGSEQEKIDEFFENMPLRFAWEDTFEFYNTFNYEDLVVDEEINVFNIPQKNSHADSFKKWFIGAKYAIDKQQVAAMRIQSDGPGKDKDKFDASQAKRTWWESESTGRYLDNYDLRMGTDDILRVRYDKYKDYVENEYGVLEKRESKVCTRFITQQAISMIRNLDDISNDTIFSDFKAKNRKIIFPFQTSTLYHKEIYYSVPYSSPKSRAFRRMAYKVIQDFRLVTWDGKAQVLYNFPEGIIPKDLTEEFNWELPNTLKNDGWEVNMKNSFDTTASTDRHINNTVFVQPELKFVENKRDFEAELAFSPLHREVEDELDLGIPRGYPSSSLDPYPWDEGWGE